MADGFPLPARSSQTPGFPNNPEALIFDGFDSLNTKPSRPAIEPQEMYICDGFMPLGKNNLRTLYGIGPALYTAAAGLSVVMFSFGNVKTTPYCFVFLSNGSVAAVNTSTSVSTAIAPAGTIQNPSPTTVGLSQWGSQYVVIVSSQTNGYFLWDGTLLYQAGTLGPDLSIQSDGFDYTSQPTITAIGGSGTGATFTATLQNGSLQTITVTNPGSGYTYLDYVYLAFSGGGGKTSAIGQAVISAAGVVTSINVVNGGSGYTATTSVAIYGGGGTGAVATANVNVSTGAISSFTVSNGGQGYQLPPTVVITDANNPVAQAVASLMPFGVQGNAVETFQQHVWVANGSKVLFTAANIASDFATSDGGGAFTSRDSFLKVGFTSLKQSNGFLYLLADSSLNYISGVSTSGTPPTTTFSNQNVDPQIGSPWPGSVQVFSRNIVFANSFGVHVSYGGAVTKVSLPLDGIFTTVPNFANFNPSSAVAILFGIHVYMLLLPIIDQVTGQQENKLLMWDGKKWWTASQEINLTWVATQEIDSVMSAWGTDGNAIYPLFNQPSSTLTKTVQSRLWMVPSYIYNPMTSRVLGLFDYKVPSTEAITIKVDNGIGGTSSNVVAGQNVLTWTNNTGAAITWTNNSAQPITWVYGGIDLPVFSITQPGPLLGITVQTNAPDLTVVSVTAVVQQYQTRI